MAFAALVLLASCTSSRYGCYKRGRCVDAEKKESPHQRQHIKSIA